MSGVPTHQLLMSNRRTVTPIEGPELLEDTGKECPRTGYAHCSTERLHRTAKSSGRWNETASLLANLALLSKTP